MEKNPLLDDCLQTMVVFFFMLIVIFTIITLYQSYPECEQYIDHMIVPSLFSFFAISAAFSVLSLTSLFIYLLSRIVYQGGRGII